MRKKKCSRVCRENCQSYRHPQQITWHCKSFYGIRGMFLDLSKSYLTNQQQYTDLNGTESDLSNLDFGVHGCK